MKNQLFHVPILSKPDLGVFRAPGPGLGNLMFPMARALVSQQELGGCFVFPTMRQLKIGPYLRGERDKRTYGDIFRKRSLQELAVWTHTRFLDSRNETEFDNHAPVITYEGSGRYFYDIEEYSELIRKFLEKTARSKIQNIQFDVAMHVRLGDFALPTADGPTQNTRVPLEWYGDALTEVRSLLGKRTLRGILFSDEDPHTVIKELKLEGFEPEPSGNALTTVMLMSRASVLIASRSTFSLWAQYLGQAHAIWPGDFDLRKYKLPNPRFDTFL